MLSIRCERLGLDSKALMAGGSKNTIIKHVAMVQTGPMWECDLCDGIGPPFFRGPELQSCSASDLLILYQTF